MSDTMRNLDMNAALTAAMVREQVGGRYDVCFQETQVTNIPF